MIRLTIEYKLILNNELKKILVFALESNNNGSETQILNNLVIQKWSPSFRSFIPPNSEMKYFLFWLAHYIRIFKNRSFCAYQIIKEGQYISSLVCVPALFIWPFMKRNDIQLKDVYTHPDYRGKGLALALINHVKKNYNNKNCTLWYMTHDRNYSSINLCKKAGFVFKGYFQKNRRLLYLIKVGNLYNSY